MKKTIILGLGILTLSQCASGQDIDTISTIKYAPIETSDSDTLTTENFDQSTFTNEYTIATSNSINITTNRDTTVLPDLYSVKLVLTNFKYDKKSKRKSWISLDSSEHLLKSKISQLEIDTSSLYRSYDNQYSMSRGIGHTRHFTLDVSDSLIARLLYDSLDVINLSGLNIQSLLSPRRLEEIEKFISSRVQNLCDEKPDSMVTKYRLVNFFSQYNQYYSDTIYGQQNNYNRSMSGRSFQCTPIKLMYSIQTMETRY